MSPGDDGCRLCTKSNLHRWKKNSIQRPMQQEIVSMNQVSALSSSHNGDQSLNGCKQLQSISTSSEVCEIKLKIRKSCIRCIWSQQQLHQFDTNCNFNKLVEQMHFPFRQFPMVKVVRWEITLKAPHYDFFHPTICCLFNHDDSTPTFLLSAFFFRLFCSKLF